MSEAHKHHFVPKFLLRPWLVEQPAGQHNLWGYWWDKRKLDLTCKRRGVESFCFQIDLLTLKSYRLGRDAIEQVFFGGIDTKGAAARAAMLELGPANLTAEQRSDFARLLLSLEARRPGTVKKIRATATDIAGALDNDKELVAKLKEFGIEDAPSIHAQKAFGLSLEDRALRLIQGLVDNRKVGERLINANWHVRSVGKEIGSFILSDRPLIRIYGYDHPNAVWAVPLTAYSTFFATNSAATAAVLLRTSDERFVKNTNMSSARQTERFAFSIDEFHAKWLGKYLQLDV